MATKLKVGGGGGDKKTKVKVSTAKASSTDLAAANKFAKDFALRKALVSGEDTHVGGVIPKFIEGATGRELPAGGIAPVGMLSNKVPAEIKSLEWDAKANLPYYIDPKSGDSKYVAKELFYLPRFRRSSATPALNSIAKL